MCHKGTPGRSWPARLVLTTALPARWKEEKEKVGEKDVVPVAMACVQGEMLVHVKTEASSNRDFLFFASWSDPSDGYLVTTHCTNERISMKQTYVCQFKGRGHFEYRGVSVNEQNRCRLMNGGRANVCVCVYAYVTHHHNHGSLSRSTPWGPCPSAPTGSSSPHLDSSCTPFAYQSTSPLGQSCSC